MYQITRITEIIKDNGQGLSYEVDKEVEDLEQYRRETLKEARKERLQVTDIHFHFYDLSKMIINNENT